MKTVNYIFAGFILALLMLTACNPNKELYEDLDSSIEPYSEKLEYTLTDADYNSLDGSIKTYKAFNDTALAMNYVPSVLAKNFIALNLKSAIKVTYNFMLIDTLLAWENVVFGYTLTDDDYEAIGDFYIEKYHYFWDAPGYNASDHLPGYLPNLYPDAAENDSVAIIYNFNIEGQTTIPYADWYKFNGTIWDYQRTISTVAEADEVLSEEDYITMGYNNPYFPNTSTAESKIPLWLQINFPYANKGDTKIVQYEYSTSDGPAPKAVQFEYNGSEWIKLIGYKIEIRSEQYVFSEKGWIFDPTIRFKMDRPDYTYIAENDPIAHPKYSDLGYYYGASGLHRNFDMRLLFFHLKSYTYELDDGTSIVYTPEEDDPELFTVYNEQGADAATELLFHRIVQEGLILLLEHKFPKATPMSEGVEVHYIVEFETYNDLLTRSYLEAEYKCITAGTEGSPAEFEFVDGPRERTN
ncbi:MAG: hypothetical protein PHE03_05350 [Bacteroidales bacterium]|nr:hypothetical protein [Bacteroidales bacterium]MDD3891712.1 hypothetical protein [Bacteroidales bacterium]